MGLEAIYKNIEDVPEQYRDLYSERNGQFELTGINGVKTQADVDRLSTALTKERDDHKATKTKFQVWGDLDYEETIAKLDKIPELEAAAKDGGVDEEKMNELVEARIKTRIAPIERKLEQATTALAEKDATISEYSAKETKRTIHDSVREALVETKVLDVAHEDALSLAERIFEVGEDGRVTVKDNVGYTPGIGPKDFLGEIQAKRPHWWAPSQGGGAGGGGGGGIKGDNPWSKAGWNLTKQGAFTREHGVEKATEAAKLAGSTFGATHPPKE